MKKEFILAGKLNKAPAEVQKAVQVATDAWKKAQDVRTKIDTLTKDLVGLSAAEDKAEDELKVILITWDPTIDAVVPK